MADETVVSSSVLDAVAVNTKSVPVQAPAAITPPTVVVAASGAVVASTGALVGASATVAEVAAVAAQKVVASGGTVFGASTQTLIDRVTATGNAAAIGVVETFKAYIVAMAPGKNMPAAQGVREQALLYRSIQTAINLVDSDFQLLFATLLKMVDDQSEGVFHGSYLFRFTGEAGFPLNNNDRQGFVRILNLMTVTAPVAGRQLSLSHVDLARSLEFGFTEAGKKRVMTFFNK